MLIPPLGVMMGYGSPPIDRPNRVATEVCAQSGLGAFNEGIKTPVT